MMKSPSCSCILDECGEQLQLGDLFRPEDSDGEPMSWETFWQRFCDRVMAVTEPVQDVEDSKSLAISDLPSPPPPGEYDEHEGADEDDGDDGVGRQPDGQKARESFDGRISIEAERMKLIHEFIKNVGRHGGLNVR